MKGTGAKRNVCPGSCVNTGAKFPVAPVESAPMGTCLSLWLLLRSAGEGANALLSGRYGMGGSIERCVLCRGESVTFESQTTVVAIQHVVTIYRPPWGG